MLRRKLKKKRMGDEMRYLGHSTLHVAIIIGFIWLGPLSHSQPVVCQATRTLANVGRRIDDFNTQTRQAARDEMNREMNGRTPTEGEVRATRLKKAEIREDFATLQSGYNAIVTKLNSKEALTDKFVSDVTERIRRAGARLQHNVGFLEVKERVVLPAARSTPESSLRELCIIVHAFLTNPVFETGVLVVADSEEARDLLDKIVQLSGTLHSKLGKVN